MLETHNPRNVRSSLSVVGVGAVTGYGWGVKPMLAGMASTTSAVVEQPRFSEALGRTVYGALVADNTDFDVPGTTRFQRALGAAVEEAVADAVARGWNPGASVAMVNGTVLGDVDAQASFFAKGPEPWSARNYLATMPSTSMHNVMKSHGFHGPMLSLSAMCASGNTALLTAAGLLASGAATDVVVATTDLSAQADHMLQFASLGVLQMEAAAFEVSRPYQADSKGYPLGEAVAVLICSARPEGAYAHMLGGAQTTDGFHPTSINPDLVEVRRCWTQAFANAGISGADVTYMNGHGPGTAQSDGTEAIMFNEHLPASARGYSLKPLLGHCQAAAAGIEIVNMCLAYDTGIIPAAPVFGPTSIPTLAGPTPYEAGITIKSSIGLGGHNTLTVFAPAG